MSTIESSSFSGELDPAAMQYVPTEGRDPDAVSSTAAAALGRFRYDALTETWWWSPEMFAIHGVTEGETLLTTSMVMSLKHPEDRAEAQATFHRAVESGLPFTHPHRVRSADGAVRHVITVGEGVVLGERVVAVHGYMVDVTDSVEKKVQEDVWQTASRLIEQRAVIERAKGALMVTYGLDAEEAFTLLRTWSSNRNEKLRDVASRVVDNL